MAIITATDLTKNYITYKRGDSLRETVASVFRREKVVVEAVKGVSFSVDRGEIVGLLGKNGAGKSTTLKMLTGILLPTKGEVDVLGFSPFRQRSKYVSRIGGVFGQKSQLVWDIPPLDSFRMNKAIYGVPDGVYNGQLELMAGILNAGEIIKRPTRSLSLGERMKCEFIMAMLHKPEVVFLDEPTIGLDILAKEAIRLFILDMNRKGVTFILTTHDIQDVERLAGRVIIINSGEKVFEDTQEALKRRLGERKSVDVVFKTPVEGIALDGVTVLSRKNPMEAAISVDCSVTPMNRFIAYMSELGEIADISIRGPGMEEIIKSIYAGG